MNGEATSADWDPPLPSEKAPPPHPRKDWRWWVGLVGRILVVTGLLLLAFVAYQL
ncbi:MAG TPA: hypothetical protein VH419_02210 [Nocardioidaceae bacterium]